MTILMYVLLYLLVGLLHTTLALKRNPVLDDTERLVCILFWPLDVSLVFVTTTWTVFTDGLLWILKAAVRDR